MSDNDAGSSTSSAPGRPFKPGQSGNPDGRPKWLKQIRDDLRALLPDAKRRLGEIIRDGSHKDSTAAAKVVLEYTVPKPKQTHKVQHSGDVLGSVSAEELVAFVKGGKE